MFSPLKRWRKWKKTRRARSLVFLCLMETRNPSASFISTIFSRQEFDGSVKRISSGLRRKAQNISLLLLDVDGVLTDGRIIIDDRGVETKHFHVRDGGDVSKGIGMLVGGGLIALFPFKYSVVVFGLLTTVAVIIALLHLPD